MRRGKYGNKKTVVDGISFASKREAKRYAELKLLEKCGEIDNLQLQVHYPLSFNCVRICTYIADFRYSVNDCFRSVIVEDAKGYRTPVYKLKKKLMKACYGIEIKEV